MTQHLRITVLGNSVPLLIAPHRDSRAEGTYVQWIERLLSDGGRTVEMENHARWNEQVTASTKQFDTRVRRRPPDVLVVHYGTVEMFPAVIPGWLHRHIHTWTRRQTPIALAYGRLLVNRLWPLLRGGQRQLLRGTQRLGFKMRPQRFAREMHHLIELAVYETRPLVLAIGIGPATGAAAHWVPGIEWRRTRFNAIVREVADRHAHEGVRFVDVEALQSEMDPDKAQPDGLHMSAESHRRLGALLVREIDDWLSADAAG